MGGNRFAAKESLHLTRSTGRKIQLDFGGGEVVLQYRGEVTCSDPCLKDDAPLISARVDAVNRLDRFGMNCLAGFARCQQTIATGLSAGVHKLTISIVKGTEKVYFRFDGLSVCPRTMGGVPLKLGGLSCGFTEYN